MRKYINLLYKICRKLFQKLNGYSFSDAKNILIIPDNNNLFLEKKLNWYLPAKDLTIHTVKEKHKVYDLLLINDIKYLYTWYSIKNLYKTKIVDPSFYGPVETSNWNSLYFSILNNKQKDTYTNLYKNNFIKLQNQYTHYDKSVLFLSGPSITKYKKFNFNHTLNIICNSIVKDKQLLEYVKPDVVVFADPVFHFSHNEYAEQFRQDMLDCVKKYNCYIIIPDFVAPILLAHHPELKDHIIAFPFTDNINFPSLDNFHVKGTDNILTLMMLPIASSFTDEIYVIGADGRKKEETYFWQHSSSVQYDDMMQKAFEAHPSFFRDQHYDDYYEKHCKMVEKYINYGEKQNKHFFALTHSYIPALKERYKEKL